MVAGGVAEALTLALDLGAEDTLGADEALGAVGATGTGMVSVWLASVIAREEKERTPLAELLGWAADDCTAEDWVVLLIVRGMLEDMNSLEQN